MRPPTRGETGDEIGASRAASARRASPTGLRTWHAVAGFAAITIVYFGALLWVDSRGRVFAALPRLASAMPLLLAASMTTYLVRYVRWHWLLARSGYRVPFGFGLLAYLGGFAFTATPGKVGELIRIRYLASAGVPADRVIGAFVYERVLDLVVVLALASFAITDSRTFGVAFALVVALLVVLVVLGLRPRSLTGMVGALRGPVLGRLAGPVGTLLAGLSSCRTWFTLPDGVVGLGCGVLTWTIASGAFVWLLDHLGVSLPVSSTFAIFPIAMLAGAVSMVPGGVGSTEAAIIAILASFGVPLVVGTLAAVGIRLSSLWFAVLVGLAAAAILESGRSPVVAAPQPGRKRAGGPGDDARVG